MTFRLFTLLFGLLVTMVGCATVPAPEVKIIYTETLTLVEPDPQYLMDCRAAEPPSAMEYSTLGGKTSSTTGVSELVARLYAREDALSHVLIEQYGYVRDCSDDKRHLRQLVEKQRAIVAAHNAEQKAKAEATQAALKKGD